ncbi:MAG: recombinase family protein [Acidobacteria bacterium]|nr:recombinase family protein [Acidobacteriota bacterium]
MTASRKPLRCAVYTRKSSEEGLEQDFNSLEAQREACTAYIKSQAHEGWRLLPERFDDGGFSGGSLERPALQRLLEQVREKRLDIIVIYKIDRLTRSLMDFAKLAEVFDKEGVSFVSVTQQFNTTTSMGRLMLNVLLSFAQFEREITGERIRDKIAASKKKGIWMGGSVPAGYDVKNRQLVINEEHAGTVRTLFRLYIELGSVRKVWAEAKRLGIKTPVRTTQGGKITGGKQFFPGNIYQLLSSPIYIGKLPHKDEVYDGNHLPLIDAAQWQAVQAGIAANRVDRRYGRNAKNPSPLAGLLYDAKGMRFTPTHTVKKTGQRYRYYVDPALTTGVTPAKADLPRIPALEIEHAVRKGIARFLNDTKALLAALGTGMKGPAAERAISRGRELAADLLDATPMTWMPPIRPALEKIVLREDAIVFSIEPSGLHDVLFGQAAEPTAAPSGKSGSDREAKSIQYLVPAEVRLRKSGAMKLVIGNERATPLAPDLVLTGTIARAYAWAEKLKRGGADSVREIAKAEGVTESYVTRMLRLGFTAPEVVEAIANGRQPVDLTANRLLKLALPALWTRQRKLIDPG